MNVHKISIKTAEQIKRPYYCYPYLSFKDAWIMGVSLLRQRGVQGVPCCLGSAVFGSLCLCSNLIKCEKRGQA